MQSDLGGAFVKNLRRKWNRFLYNNNHKGIPNLMLYLSIGTIIVFFLSIVDPSNLVTRFLCFDRSLILKGQVWRLFTYVLVPQSSGIWLVLLLVCYYSIGRMVESVWGTLKFNLFYLSGVILMDLGGLIFGTYVSAYYLNLSLFLALATMFPDNRVMLMYIIPVKMKYLSWAYLLIAVGDIISGDLSPLFAIANYFLFFGKDVLNVLPGADRVGSRSMNFHFGRKKSTRQQRPNPNWADGYQRTTQQTHKKVVDAPAYRHKCTVCGKTDVSHPNLEFRYCSKCSGYYCYCQDHINSHTHIV